MRHWRLSLAMAVLAGAACGSSGLNTRDGGGTDGGGGAGGNPNRWTGTINASINRNVDVLFMIDDSSGMRLSQSNFLTNFPTFLTTLQNDVHGLPNIHIAVVSQDMGAGDGSIAGCDATGGKKGIFQYTSRTPAGVDCTANALNQGATFISNIAGTTNYTGNLVTVFTCIASLGSTGCGFEHQFAAVLRALGADGSAAPAENQGFLRPDAYLVVVMLTDEDDCSATPAMAATFFDTASNNNIASTLGPSQNFRCNEFGHLCTIGGGAPMRPSRLAPNNDVNQMVTYDGCTSNDAGGYLLSVKQTADSLKALKADPSLVALVAFTGAPTPYTVHWKMPSTPDTSCNTMGQLCPWPEISHSCTATDGSFADPGVRTTQLVSEFGAHGLMVSICDQSFAPGIQRTGELINGLLGPPCLPGPVGTSAATGQPACKVTEHYGTVNQTVPSCIDSGDAAPCWQVQSAPTCGADGISLSISADPNVPLSATVTASYDCAKCPSTDIGVICY